MDMAIARIGEEIIEQKLILSNINSQRNSNSVTFRLPTEIFETIFIECARDDHENDPLFSSQAPPSINVSYVCRRWRAIALNCSILWTYICAHRMSLRWIEELLARSEGKSLKIHINFPLMTRANDARWLKIMNCIERIQDLSLKRPVSGTHEALYQLPSPAFRLQNLKITMGYLDPDASKFLLFDGDTPALRTLELSESLVPWHSFKLNSLTTLRVHFVPLDYQPSMATSLAALSCMQDLRYLDLDRALASATGFLSSAAFNSSPKINLARLSRLAIVAPLSTIIAFLSCVNIPSKTEVRLENCDVEPHSSLHDYAPLRSLLARIFSKSKGRALSSPVIRSFIIDSSGRSATLSFSTCQHDYNCVASTAEPRWDCDIPLNIHLEWGITMTRRDGESIISEICCSMPLTNVQSVHVMGLRFWSNSDFLEKTLGRLPNLRYLKLSRSHMPDLASVLSLAPSDCTENCAGHTDRRPEQAPIAPALEELELCDNLLSEQLEIDMIPDPWTAANLRPLYDALASRTESPGQLTISDCIVATRSHDTVLDMVGRWKDGRFHVIEEHTRCYLR